MYYESFPFIIGWELTLACNIRCIHCASSASGVRANELALKEALSLCDQFPDLLVNEVDFTGGEALMHPYWFEIAKRLNKYEITTRIITNGAILSNDLINKISDAGITTIAISIDGLEGTHDYIRNCKGLYKKVISAIERITNHTGLEVGIITVINKLNRDHLPSLYELLYNLGVTTWQIQPVFPLGRCSKATELHLSEAEYYRIKNFLSQYLPLSQSGSLSINTADCLGYYANIEEIDMEWYGCGAGIAACGIMSDGRVKGCLSLPEEFIEGSIREKDLWDIWFSEDAFLYTRRQTESECGPNCSACDRKSVCRGGCSVMSYGNTGQLHNDPFCFYRLKDKYEDLLKKEAMAISK